MLFCQWFNIIVVICRQQWYIIIRDYCGILYWNSYPLMVTQTTSIIELLGTKATIRYWHLYQSCVIAVRLRWGEVVGNIQWCCLSVRSFISEVICQCGHSLVRSFVGEISEIVCQQDCEGQSFGWEIVRVKLFVGEIVRWGHSLVRSFISEIVH